MDMFIILNVVHRYTTQLSLNLLDYPFHVSFSNAEENCVKRVHQYKKLLKKQANLEILTVRSHILCNFLVPEILNKSLQKFTEKFIFLCLNTNFKCTIGLLKWTVIKTNVFKTLCYFEYLNGSICIYLTILVTKKNTL